ncbi:gustatory receptor 25 [Nasonia vitripennis]|uniref:Gustatory receptor n=1 Tax=Nasonia vitripennis TaxID=7425 RepID=A0A7M6UWK5_NASVI|nr:gustatory receptor 25 [Nasonia vitripennis]
MIHPFGFYTRVTKQVKMLHKNIVNKESIILKFIFYYFKLVGLSCVSFSSKSRLDICFLTSKLGALYNVILALLITCFNYYVVLIVVKVSFGSLHFDRAIDFGRVCLAVISSVFILITYCFKRKKATIILNRINTIAELSVNLRSNGKSGHDGLCKPAKRIFFVFLVTWLVLIAVTPKLKFYALLYFAAQYSCEMVIMCMLVQYSMLLSILKQLFETINARFTISSEANFQVRRFSQHRSNEFGLEVKLNRFSYLRELHLSLCEVAEDLSQFYSQSLLFCIAYVFSSLVLYAYFFVKIVTQKGDGIINTATTRFIIVKLLHYIGPTVTVTWAACAVVNESNRTGKIVNKWMGDSRDQYVAIKLNQFSNYLLHQKLSFRAAGLFSLDGTLMMSIAASITTYIMILLQFQDSTKR